MLWHAHELSISCLSVCVCTARISGLPKLKAMREGLKLFISHFLLRNAPSDGDGEGARRLKEGAQVATKAMEAKEDQLKL